MVRVLTIAGVAVAALAPVGCAGTWDTLSSRKFRKEPFTTVKHMVKPEDPLVVLRADPPREGDERAKAMRRLKEPLAAGLSQQDQDWAIDLLGRTATADPSPVLRLAAIEALSRFEDARAGGILTLAYQKAHGRPDGVADPFHADDGIKLASGSGGRAAVRLTPPALTGPVGFPPDTVTAIRCRTLEAMGRVPRAEAVRFMATVARGATADTTPDGADDRDVRLAAVRGLTNSRQPEAVVALAQVLSTETGKDPALAGRAHDGLVSLTGKRLPPEPKQWDEVIQAGVTVAPEPNWVQAAAAWMTP